MKKMLNLARVVVILTLASPAFAVTITIDDHTGVGAGTGFSLTGTWAEAYNELVLLPTVGGGYTYPWPPSIPETATATFTPGDVDGFLAGKYAVYVSWGVYSGHLGVTYTVNHEGGSDVFHFDDTKNAAQGASGSLPSRSTSGSGYYLLGTYELDALSNVVHSGGGAVDALMIRAGVDGRFIDHQSANVQTSDPAAWTMEPALSVPTGNYFYANEDGLSVAWTDIADKAGSYNLKVSWGSYYLHSTSVKYLVDIDGNGQQDVGDSLITIDQSKMADQLTVSNGTWSGFYDLGNFVLSADSQLLQWNGNTGTFMTVAPMLVTPTFITPGDANGDHMVNERDAGTLAANWQSTAATWSMGDFNGDNKVDDIDATMMAVNWYVGVNPSATVPEPSTLALFVSLGIVVFCRRGNRLLRSFLGEHK